METSTEQQATGHHIGQAGPGGITIIGDGNVIHPAPPSGPPLQRPPRAPHFTDREAALQRLLADLQPGQVVTLCGPGGIGKTALAAEAIWTLAPGDALPDRFPDGVLWHSFYGRPDPALALEYIIRSFGAEPQSDLVEAARRALGGKRALLLLDGVEEAADLRPLLAVRDRCGLLLTSRRHKDAVADFQDVPPLPPAEAVRLLQAWGGAQAADEAAAQRICALVGYLPLAVRLVGRYLAETGETAADYLAWLVKTPLEALDHGQQRTQSVPLLLEKSLTQVSPAAVEAMAIVGQLALAPFSREAVAAALHLEPGPTGRLLGELVNYGLLTKSPVAKVKGQISNIKNPADDSPVTSETENPQSAPLPPDPAPLTPYFLLPFTKSPTP